MKNFFQASLVLLALALPSLAQEADKKISSPASLAAEQPALAEATKPADTRSSFSKEERKAKLTSLTDEMMKTLTEKAKNLNGGPKKFVELQIAHAKLEMDAAKEAGDIKNYSLRHLKKAHRYLKQGLKVASKGTEEKKENAASIAR